MYRVQQSCRVLKKSKRHTTSSSSSQKRSPFVRNIFQPRRTAMTSTTTTRLTVRYRYRYEYKYISTYCMWLNDPHRMYCTVRYCTARYGANTTTGTYRYVPHVQALTATVRYCTVSDKESLLRVSSTRRNPEITKIINCNHGGLSHSLEYYH